MATFSKLYVSATDAPAYSPPTIRGAWDATSALVTRKALIAPVTVGHVPLSSTYFVQTGSEPNPYDILLLRVVSDRLAAQTISGTFNLGMFATLQPWPDPWNWHVHIYVTVGDTDVVRRTLLSNYRESGLSVNYPAQPGSFRNGTLVGATLFAAAALSSGAISAGDRIVVEIGATSRDAGGLGPFPTGLRIAYGENVADQDVVFDDNGGPPGYGDFDNGYLTFSTPIALLVTPTPPATIAPGYSGGVPEIAWVDFFHKDSAGAAQTFHWSQLPAAGPIYPLEARGIDLGVCERKASEHGQLEGSTFTFTVADTDNAIRAYLGNAFQVALLDVEVVTKVEALADFMAGLAPLVVFRGKVKSYEPKGRQFTFTVQDQLSSRLGEDLILPRAATDFPGTPAANRDRVGPLVYGAVSDEGSSSAGPVNAAEASSETYANVCGYGSLGGTPPTGVAAVDAGATGALAAATYYLMVTTVKNGVESDPSPFYGVDTLGGVGAGSGVNVAVAGGHAINASCTNMGAAADSYRFYLGTFFFGFRWTVMVESVTPAVTFTSDDPTVQAGGRGCYVFIGAYAASFLYANGETPLTTNVNIIYIGIARGFRRPIRAVFVGPAPVGVLGMRIYRKFASGGYDRVWTIPLTQVNGAGNLYFEDDLLDTGVTYINGAPTPVGKLVPFYVGDFTDLTGGAWSGFAIAGHACADPAVLNVYLDGVVVNAGRYGIDIAAPGQAGFATYFGATTYRLGGAGNRWTLLYLRGSDAADVIAGTKALTANVNGVEDVGDGSGALISSLNYQAKHFARNFLMCDQAWQGDVDWLPMPTWSDGEDRIDDGSFAQAESDAALLIGDTSGARAITSKTRMLDVFAAMAVDADCAYGFTRVGKLKWFLEDPTPFAVAVATTDEIQDTAVDSFGWKDEVDAAWFFNRAEYSYDPTYDASGGVTLSKSATIEDAIAQLLYGKNGKKRLFQAASPFEFSGRRNAAAVTAVMRRILARASRTPRHITQQLGLIWFLREIGDVLAVTNSEGVGPSGWTDQLMRVRQISADFGPWMVSLKCRQISSALLVSLPAYLVEEFMSDIDLGGVWAGSPADLTNASSQTVLPFEYRDRMVQWPVVPASAVVEALVYAKVDDAGLTITPEVFNITDGAVVVTGSPATSTSWPSSPQTLTIPRPVDGLAKEYRLRATVAGGNTVAEPTRTVGLLGTIRVLFP